MSLARSPGARIERAVRRVHDPPGPGVEEPVRQVLIRLAAPVGVDVFQELALVLLADLQSVRTARGHHVELLLREGPELGEERGGARSGPVVADDQLLVVDEDRHARQCVRERVGAPQHGRHPLGPTVALGDQARPFHADRGDGAAHPGVEALGAPGGERAEADSCGMGGGFHGSPPAAARSGALCTSIRTCPDYRPLVPRGVEKRWKSTIPGRDASHGVCDVSHMPSQTPGAGATGRRRGALAPG